MLRRFLLLCLLPFLFFGTPAFANCIGQDMLSELRADDPEGIDAMFARAHAIPNAQGRFWKVERDGVAPSHLFGTFHASEVVDQVPDAVWQALDVARVAVFELSQEEQDAMNARITSDPTFTMDLSAPPLLNKLSEGQRRTLSEAFQARGLPVEAANQMRPWLLASLLGFPACHLRAAAAGAQVLDNVMVERAEANGAATEGLETYEGALAGFSGFDRDQLIKVLVADDALMKREEDIYRTSALLYEAGETAAINEFSIWLAERQNLDFDPRAFNESFMKNLLDGRNQNWMPALMQHLNGGKAFVGVGALHLPGEAGLIELLRAEGYTVTRLD